MNSPNTDNRSWKNILGLVCSPRRLGNSECVIKEISRQLQTRHRLKLLRLSDLEIQPCRACYTCLSGTQDCPLNDDLNIIIQELCQADGVIVAAPTYFLGPNAQLKNLLDRGLSLYASADRLWKKPAVGVGIAGIPGKEGYTLLGIESFLKLILTDVKQVSMVFGALPGEALLSPQTRSTTRELAESLFGRPSSPHPCCPLCGGQTFRFLDHTRVRCMLCSNQGTLTQQDGRISFDITRSEHELFLSLADVQAHHAWLQGMKERFREQRRQLLAVCKAYKEDGNWVQAEKFKGSSGSDQDKNPLPGGEPGG